ncbi:vacuolar protein sorting-associated protein 2 homolog 2-like [Magnolia sinica]|uniref:vacuolar protein sorting-associated protein 2 homolog 2-like n=1 Tax=Magnolia sinica TaxID=86752 RepID=UPI00265B4CBD|nr:vacuolar protein sorting-associated protein 2 homolog 2-like [Magnolia sinica]
MLSVFTSNLFSQNLAVINNLCIKGSGDGTLHAWSISRCNEAATRILARQLVCLRQQITNLQGSRAQIRGVATHTQAMYSNTSISVGMKGASKAMAAMNKECTFAYV